MIALEKKVKIQDKPGAAKIIYSVVIALLCITAIIVGVVAANNRNTPDDNPITPPVDDGGNNGGSNGGGNNTEPPDDNPKPEKVSFIAPCVGKVVKAHDLSVPVYSETLEEWRVHAGIDISCEEGAGVYAATDGEVTAVYSHPLNGFTVELTHANNIKSVYSNLDKNAEGTVKLGDKVKSGDKIGAVGDTSLSELAEESHLHFEVVVGDAKVNPLDYISDEAKKSSLGIEG